MNHYRIGLKIVQRQNRLRRLLERVPCTDFNTLLELRMRNTLKQTDMCAVLRGIK
jgi:hypothetical protein